MKFPDDRLYLIVSYVQTTTSFSLNPNGELREFKMNGFCYEARSLFCHEAIHNQLLQVTSESIGMVSSTDGSLTYECRAPSGWSYGVATANATQVLLATKSKYMVELIYLEIGDGVLQQILKAKMEYQVSCLDLTPIGENPNHSDLAAVGFWIKYSVSIYSLPDLVEKINVDLGSTVPRSVLFCTFEGIPYLLCGRGDGDLFYYRLNTCTGVLTHKKVVSLGITPVTLRTDPSNDALVLALCYNRAIMVYSRGRELVHSYVNLTNITDVCAFGSSAFPDRYAIVKENGIFVGTLDNYESLCIYETISLGGEYATSVSYQQKTNTIAICSVKPSLFEEPEKYSVHFLDDRYFDFKSTYYLDPGEQGRIIVSISFSDDDRVYFCVGTAYPFPVRNQSIHGRILVFCIAAEGYKFELIAQLKTKGQVYCLNPFNGKLLASIGSCIQIYDWMIQDDGTYKLQSACRARRHNIFAHSVLTRGNSIVLGDSQKTIVLLKYDATEKAIKLVGRTNYTMHGSSWVGNIELLRDNAFLVASSGLDLITGMCFGTPGRSGFHFYTKYHLGQEITRFRHGSLVADAHCSTRFFGTQNGGIGVVASLHEELFRFLRKFQLEMTEVVECVGGLSHTQWRGFNSENDWTSNFLDGDLIESFLDLQPAQMEAISGRVKRPVAELLEIVEKLRRLH